MCAGHEGRAGMASVIARPGSTFDGKKLFERATRDLPMYARPLFIRLQVTWRSLTYLERAILLKVGGDKRGGGRCVCQQEEMEMTSTFKQQKFQLVQSGFNPSKVTDPIYVLDYEQQSYVPLTDGAYQNILSGQHRL